MIDILGMTPQGLRIGLGKVTVIAPNALLQQEMGEVDEARAAEWAAALQDDLHAAILTLCKGSAAPRPFDLLLLEEEV
ncbi:MAG: hypothetical protein N4A70_12300 [Pelagimonas sp.]|jgi:hypothetical protein|nr:hypothetical protein [Pelagimonas sp.]